MEITESALNAFGSSHQIEKLKEELKELLEVASSINTSRPGSTISIQQLRDFTDELVDVGILIEQMRFLVGEKRYDDRKHYKLARLGQILQEKKDLERGAGFLND